MPIDSRHLFPQNPRLQFISEGHSYVYATATDPVQHLKPLSTSGIISRAEPEAMNYASWRNSLIRNGMSRDEADLYMDVFCEYRMQVGTDFHQLVEATLCNEVAVIPPATGGEAVQMLSVWRREFLPRIVEVYIVELPIIHRTLYYTGTPDLVCRMDDGLVWLVDWKTKQNEDKARVREDWIIRLASYAMLLKSEYGLVVDRAMNTMVWSTGLKNKCWNMPDLQEGANTYLRYLAKVHGMLAVDCHVSARAYSDLMTMCPWLTSGKC
jgi:hypothetical protein